MSLQVTRQYKGFVTNITCKWLLLVIGAYTSLQGTGTLEKFLADLTCMCPFLTM
jgi:hypothetical protein